MKKLLYTLSVILILASCQEAGPTEAELETKFESFHQAIIGAKEINEISLNADSLIAVVNEMELKYPENKKLAEMLFIAGDASFQKRDGESAVAFFTKVASEKYDGVEGAKQAQALYLKGFAYEQLLDQTRDARDAYREVIKRFPETMWSKEYAKGALKYLGKGNLEMLKEMQSANNEDTLSVDSDSAE